MNNRTIKCEGEKCIENSQKHKKLLNRRKLKQASQARAMQLAERLLMTLARRV